jgi:hypothetical protein
MSDNATISSPPPKRGPGRPTKEEAAARAAAERWAAEKAAGGTEEPGVVIGKLGDEVYHYGADMTQSFGWLTRRNIAKPWLWDINILIPGGMSTRDEVPYSEYPAANCWTFKHRQPVTAEKSE